MPKVSVITLCPISYLRYLPECAASVHGQTYKDFEWIVVIISDGQIATRDRIQIVDISHAVEGKMRLAYVSPDPGISSSRNLGLELAMGEYVTMLDADDILGARFLERVVAKAGPKKLVCPGIAEFENGTGRGWPTWGTTLEDFAQANRIFACTMYPLQLIKDVGGYDEALNWLGIEDYELWIRAVKAGYTVEVVPEILFSYRVHGGSHTSRFKQYDEERFAYVRKKHGLV